MRTSGSPAELEYRRCLAIDRLLEGYSAQEIADFLGVDPRSVRRWWATFRRDGITGLAARPASGRPAKLSRTQEKLVRRWLAAALFGTLGLFATSRLPRDDHDADAEAPKLRWTRIPGRLVLIGLACFFCLMAEGGASDWSAKLVRDDLEGTAALGAIAYAVFSVGMGAGRLLADRLWARWGTAGLLARSGALAALGFAAGLGAGTPNGAIAGFAALGVGLAGVVPTLFRAGADQPGVSTGPALAAVTSLGYLGFLAGPPIIGAVAQFSSLRLACGVLVLAGVVVVALARFADTDDREGRVVDEPVADDRAPSGEGALPLEGAEPSAGPLDDHRQRRHVPDARARIAPKCPGGRLVSAA